MRNPFGVELIAKLGNKKEPRWKGGKRQERAVIERRPTPTRGARNDV